MKYGMDGGRGPLKYGCKIKDKFNNGPGFVQTCAFHNFEERRLNQKLCTWIKMKHVRASTLARKGGVRASEKDPNGYYLSSQSLIEDE